jgi:long-chain acyl-CoA synthetase
MAPNVEGRAPNAVERRSPIAEEMRMHGATTLNLASIIEHHARLRPDRVAFICGEQRLTFGQLDAMANQVAHGLRARGIGPGQHVALSCPNVPHFPIGYFAILKTGAVVVPLNVLLKPLEIAYHLSDSDATAFLCFEGTPELPMASMGKSAFDQVAGCEHFIVLTKLLDAPSPIDGGVSLAQVMKGQPGRFATYPTQSDDTAVMLYTSGTTGHPKGAELTHLNMFLNASISRDLFLPAMDPAPEAENVELITLPLFHSTGQTAQMNACLYNGTTMVLLPRFEPKAVFEAMVRERINCWVAVPTMYWALLRYAKANDVDTRAVAQHLRLCASGGAPMPVEVMKDFQKTFGVRILEGYGLSETAPVACFNHFQRPSKPGTVGQPLLAVEVACVDANDEPVPVGERGEIVIRGHNVMKGYYKRPDATADVMRNGWFHTGDVGIFDEDGYLSIVDRIKDLILRGGFNVYPRELEELLMTHPDVSLCAVVGVPDERLGEEVKAYIVSKPGAAATEGDIIAWCKERMAAYKYPRFVEFRDQLPIGATGKVLKRALKQEVSA